MKGVKSDNWGVNNVYLLVQFRVRQMFFLGHCWRGSGRHLFIVRALEGVIGDTGYRQFFTNGMRYWPGNFDTLMALKSIL